jgi:phospholipase C
VPPPVPPAGTTNEFVDGLPIGLGFRVPAIVVSPWSVGCYVCSDVLDHTSLIRLIEARFGVTEPNISSQINIPWSNGSLLRLIGP